MIFLKKYIKICSKRNDFSSQLLPSVFSVVDANLKLLDLLVKEFLSKHTGKKSAVTVRWYQSDMNTRKNPLTF